MTRTVGSLGPSLFVCLAMNTFAAGPVTEPANAGEAAAKKAAADKAINEKYQQWRATLTPEHQAWQTKLEECLGGFYLPLYKSCWAQGMEQAWDYVKDDPTLPRALLIGDSVSRGYTLPARKALAGKVNVHRAPENCGPTVNGLKKLDIWLGDGRWQVIHFNFGIHDGKTPLAHYEQRLEQIVTRLQKTGATLIWASTTPIPDDPAIKQSAESIVERNAIAARVMQKHGIAIDDLFTAITPKLAEYQIPKDVHFNDAGYDFLGRKVAEAIAAALKIAPAVAVAGAAGDGPASAAAATHQAVPSGKLSFPDETIDTWHGFKRHKFGVNRRCWAWVVEPNEPLPGNPWSWCMEFPDIFTENCAAIDLLEAGYFHVHIGVGNTFGSPEAIRHFNTFYDMLTEAGLAKKAALIVCAQHNHPWPPA